MKVTQSVRVIDHLTDADMALQCMKVTQSVRIDAFDEKEFTEVAIYVGNVEC